MNEETLEHKRLQKLEKAGIKVLPAAIRYSRSEEVEHGSGSCCGLAVYGLTRPRR